jgi:tRNA and rRNA cytosine-C5-methylases
MGIALFNCDKHKPSDFTCFTNYFDVILTDVPCSGEGMFRKDEQAVSEWSEDNVNLCASRQKSILDDIWDTLRPGGLLIYSTCTYNLEENEHMIKYLVDSYGAEPVEVSRNASWHIKDSLDGCIPVNRFMPHATKGEGLFMAVVRKPEEEDYDECSLLSSAKRNMKSKKKGKGTNLR